MAPFVASVRLKVVCRRKVMGVILKLRIRMVVCVLVKSRAVCGGMVPKMIKVGPRVSPISLVASLTV